MEYHESPGALPEVRRQTSLTSTPAEDRRPSLCQSEVLPYHQTIEEALQEEPWTVQSNLHPRFTLIHSSPAPAFPLHPPRLPHIPVRTGVSRQTGSWGSAMRYTTLSPRE